MEYEQKTARRGHIGPDTHWTAHYIYSIIVRIDKDGSVCDDHPAFVGRYRLFIWW